MRQIWARKLPELTVENVEESVFCGEYPYVFVSVQKSHVLFNIKTGSLKKIDIRFPPSRAFMTRSILTVMDKNQKELLQYDLKSGDQFYRGAEIAKWMHSIGLNVIVLHSNGKLSEISMKDGLKHMIKIDENVINAVAFQNQDGSADLLYVQGKNVLKWKTCKDSKCVEKMSKSFVGVIDEKSIVVNQSYVAFSMDNMSKLFVLNSKQETIIGLQNESKTLSFVLCGPGLVMTWGNQILLYDLKDANKEPTQINGSNHMKLSGSKEHFFCLSQNSIAAFDFHQESLIEASLKQKNDERVKELLLNGEDPFSVELSQFDVSKDIVKLFMRMRYGNPGSDILRIIIKKNWLDLLKKYKNQPAVVLSNGLAVAAYIGNMEALDVLIKMGANPDTDPQAVLFCKMNKDTHAPCIAKLLPITKLSENSIEQAVDRNDMKIVDKYIDQGNKNSGNAFTRAARRGRKDYIKYMLSKGLLPSNEDASGMRNIIKDDEEIETLLSSKKMLFQNRDYQATKQQFNVFLIAAKKIALAFRKLNETTTQYPHLGHEIINSLHGMNVKTKEIERLPKYCKELYAIGQLTSNWIEERYIKRTELSKRDREDIDRFMKYKEKHDELLTLSALPRNEFSSVIESKLWNLQSVQLPPHLDGSMPKKYDLLIPYNVIQRVNPNGEDMSLGQLLFKYVQLGNRIDECFVEKIVPVYEELVKTLPEVPNAPFDGMSELLKIENEEIESINADRALAERLQRELNPINANNNNI